MELRKFISATLIEIDKGVADTQSYLKENNSKMLINPTHNGGVVKAKGNYDRSIQNVEFDLSIAYTEKESQETESKENGGLGLQVVSLFSFNMGGDSKDADKWEKLNAITNRIKFSVPISIATNTEHNERKSTVRVNTF